MGAGDYSRISKVPCPHCGGEVEWWAFGADCRGNGSSGGVNCTKCNHAFDPVVFKVLEKASRESAAEEER